MQLQDLQEEIIDRFGLPPEPLKNLFRITALKLTAMPLGISKIDIGQAGGRIIFQEQANIDPARVIQLVTSKPATYKLDGRNKLRITTEMPDAEARIRVLQDLFDTIAARHAA